ncbi:urea transporter [bacterium]|nr:urea transporter [bacterium]
MHHIRHFFLGYSFLFLMNNPWVGAIVFGLTWMNPTMAVAGTTSVLFAMALSFLLSPKAAQNGSIIGNLNALLVGLAIGSRYSMSIGALLFIGIASSITVLLTMGLEILNHRSMTFPILSLPFVVTSSLTYLASPRFSNLMLYPVNYLVSADQFGSLGASAIAFFKTLGAIIFLPHTLVGIILFGTLLVYSRILAALCVGGYGLGVAILTQLTGNFNGVLHDVTNFNFCLVAMAIGGIFLRPSHRSVALASVGIAISALLSSAAESFWALYGIPAFTVPFIITTGIIYVITDTHFHRDFWDGLFSSPEHAIDRYRTACRRLSRGITTSQSSDWFPAPILFPVAATDEYIDTSGAITQVSTQILADGTISMSTRLGTLHYRVDSGWLVCIECYGNDPFLLAVSLACPKAVLRTQIGTSWTDVIPTFSLPSVIHRQIIKNFGWLVPPQSIETVGTYTQVEPHVISGIIPFSTSKIAQSRIEFLEGKGIRSVEFNEKKFLLRVPS